MLFGEAGNVLEEQSGVPASAVIGFDDDLPEWVFSATFSARLAG